MSETGRIKDLLERIHAGANWFGPSLTELLANVESGHAATARTPAGHSLWQIVLHMVAWRNVAADLLRGGDATELPIERNWPTPAETSPATWAATVQSLDDSRQNLCEAVAALPPDRLDDPVPGYQQEGNPASGITFYLLIQGVLQHDIYHAGQIAILKASHPQLQMGCPEQSGKPVPGQTPISPWNHSRPIR